MPLCLWLVYGIKNKIDPGKSFDKDLYALSEDEIKIPTVCGSLREAMESLDKDRKFDTVMYLQMINRCTLILNEEIHNFEHTSSN